MANGAFKFKDNSGNVVSHISGSGRDILFSGGTLDLSGMTGLTLGNLTLSGTTQNAQTASFAPSYLLTSSFNTYSSSLATTGSNLFKGNQTISGSIIPAVDNTYDLGSLTNQFRDLYLSSASLYIDGTKVLGSTAQELQITTDTGQSFKILEASSDTITLQSADGNITLASSGGGDVIMDPTTGVIALKGTTTLYAGNKIVSSDGNSIQFGNGIAITGSIVSTVTPLVSGSSQIIYSGLTGIPSGIVSGSEQLTSSYDGRYVLSGSITQTTWDNIASKPSGIASGSSQIDITGTTGYSTFSSSISTSIGSLSSSVATTTSGLSSSIGSLSSSVATTTLGTKNRVDSIETTTGSLNTFSSSFSTAFGLSGTNVTVKGNLTVSGTSTTIDSTTVAIGDNIIQLNGTGATNAGLVVRDATAPNTLSGSLLWDSTNDKWIAGTLGSEDDIILKTATQTLTNKTISGASNTLSNIGNGSLTNSSITIAGASTSLGGTISAATILSGTGTVSGSVQIDLTATTNYASGILTRLNAVGVFSGSAQVSLASTTGFGTYLNQAVLTTSTPTFSTVTATTFTGALSGNATTATALTSMNISQFTNNSAYLTGITSGNVTTALGFTPYNATNPNGYTTNTGTVTSVSGTGTVSGLSLSGTVTTSGNLTLGGTLTLTSGNVTTALGFTPISSYTETDTLATVTGRGASTSTALTLSGGITVTGLTIAKSAGISTITFPAGTNDPAFISHTESTANVGIMRFSVGDDNDTIDYFGFGNTNVPDAFRINANGTISTGTWQGTAIADSYISSAATWNAKQPALSGTGFVKIVGTTISYDNTTYYHAGNIPTWNQNTTGTASNITAYTINQSVGTGNSPTFAGITVNGTVVASQSGFQSATYASGRNRIWSFGNADAYGLSYFQGSGGYGGSQDMIGFHFGTASVAESKFTFVTDGRFFISGGIFPSANGTHNLGSSSLRWNTLFTSDLSLSNGIGDYTIVEGENDLFLYNNKQNKVYKFMLQEVNPNDATPKRPE